MKKLLLLLAVVLSVSAAAQAGAQVVHYWDMDTLSGGAPIDVANSSVTTTANGTITLGASYTNNYDAARGNALEVGLAGGDYLSVDVFSNSGLSGADAMDFGSDSYSFSYWGYSDDAGDSDVRGLRVFDNLSSTTVGMQLGTEAEGYWNLRCDSTSGDIITDGGTIGTGNYDYGAVMASDIWVHVAVTVNRTTNELEVFFNGTSQGVIDISGVTGDIYATQDLIIGGINTVTTAGGQQAGALDDLAFYTGVLSSAEITGLANGTINPMSIPEPATMLLLGLGAIPMLRRKK